MFSLCQRSDSDVRNVIRVNKRFRRISRRQSDLSSFYKIRKRAFRKILIEPILYLIVRFSSAPALCCSRRTSPVHDDRGMGKEQKLVCIMALGCKPGSAHWGPLLKGPLCFGVSNLYPCLAAPAGTAGNVMTGPLNDVSARQAQLCQAYARRCQVSRWKMSNCIY